MEFLLRQVIKMSKAEQVYAYTARKIEYLESDAYDCLLKTINFITIMKKLHENERKR